MDEPENEATSAWPDVVSNVSNRGFFDRMQRIERLLLQKAKLSKDEVTDALVNINPETKEKAAKWLRSELHKLKDAQKGGRHPSRRRTTLSLLEIAAAAFTMLEAVDCVDIELLSLLEELLNLDRHRGILAANFEIFERAAQADAQLTLQGKVLGVRELARQVSISVSTASKLRRSTEYKERVAFHKMCWMDKLASYVEATKGKFSEITDERAYRVAMFLQFLLGSRQNDDGTGRTPDAKEMDQALKEVRPLINKFQGGFEPVSGPEKRIQKMSPELGGAREALHSEINRPLADCTGKSVG
jgi:hypothetical protein